MEIRQQDHWLMESLIAGETIDVSTYDLVGRFSTDGKAYLCGADETPQFAFMESAATGEPVSVAFFQSASGQARVALSGSGSVGDKLSVAAGGKIGVSGTSQANEPDEDDIGVALADWTDGDEVEVFFVKGSKL